MNPLTPVWDLLSIRPRGGELLPTVDMDVIPPQVERARRTLWAGLLVFRWVSFAWFAANAILSELTFRYGPLPWIALALTGAWTLWLSVPPENQERPETPWIDLLIAVGLIVISGLVVPPGEVIGETPFFAVSYPVCAALLWGAARLAGRESMGRAIHDSVLQSLALVHKRARELAKGPMVPSDQVLELATMARDQEHALRTLIMREPEEPPVGAASLRDRMEAMVGSVQEMPVTLSAVGPVWLSAAHVETIAAAVEQALDNVVRHSKATQAVVFADVEDNWVIVSVRDNGRGFIYDERDLREAGKAGLLKSMKGRVEDLGGRMRVKTAPGVGTEVEFRVPYDRAEASFGGGTGG